MCAQALRRAFRLGFALRGEEYMYDKSKKSRRLIPRVKQLILLKANKHADTAVSITYWSICMTVLYICVLRTTIGGARGSDHAPNS